MYSIVFKQFYDEENHYIFTNFEGTKRFGSAANWAHLPSSTSDLVEPKL